MCVQTHIYTFAKKSTQSRYRKAATVRKINVFKNAYLNVNGGKKWQSILLSKLQLLVFKNNVFSNNVF